MIHGHMVEETDDKHHKDVKLNTLLNWDMEMGLRILSVYSAMTHGQVNSLFLLEDGHLNFLSHTLVYQWLCG